jgi:hypothetical protein
MAYVHSQYRGLSGSRYRCAPELSSRPIQDWAKGTCSADSLASKLSKYVAGAGLQWTLSLWKRQMMYERRFVASFPGISVMCSRLVTLSASRMEGLSRQPHHEPNLYGRRMPEYNTNDSPAIKRRNVSCRTWICSFLPACFPLHRSNRHRRFYTGCRVSVARRYKNQRI